MITVTVASPGGTLPSTELLSVLGEAKNRLLRTDVQVRGEVFA